VKYPRIFLVAGVSVVVALVGLVFSEVQPAVARRVPGSIAQFPALKHTDRLTIIAPHPDDETIALGGLIYRARQLNIPVSVIFMTNGDSSSDGAKNIQLSKGPLSMIELGKKRQQEALNALSVLGVDAKSVYFLGLPDGGLEDLTGKNWAKPYLSKSTGLQDSSAYQNSYVGNMPYTGANAQAALLKAVNTSKPTRVFVTMREDQHRDHWAAGQFLEGILRNIKTHPQHYSYLVHFPLFAALPHDAKSPLNPPVALKSRPWDVINLSQDEENHQAAAIQQYHSQLNTGDANSTVTDFTRPNELVIE
jgi:LmbE family N-acetylglucosaminyl deacetylase